MSSCYDCVAIQNRCICATCLHQRGSYTKCECDYDAVQQITHEQGEDKDTMCPDYTEDWVRVLKYGQYKPYI